MGVLVNATKGDYNFEIPIKDISGIKEGRQGIRETLNKKHSKTKNFTPGRKKHFSLQKCEKSHHILTQTGLFTLKRADLSLGRAEIFLNTLYH